MTQRDDLLAGARKCLAEKGYHQTTARDIATAANSHLASIGYHFGSKDALMNLAALEAQDEWGNTIESTVREAGGTSPAERLQTALAELVASMPSHRELILTSVQAYGQAGFTDEIRHALRAATLSARIELAAMLLDRKDDDIDPATADSVGAVLHALIIGIGATSLVAPDALPSGEQVVAGLRELMSEPAT